MHMLFIWLDNMFWYKVYYSNIVCNSVFNKSFLQHRIWYQEVRCYFPLCKESLVHDDLKFMHTPVAWGKWHKKVHSALNTHYANPNLKFPINSLIPNTTEIRRRQLLLSDDDPLKSHLHPFGCSGLGVVEDEGGTGHLSQSTPVDLGVITSWVNPPFISTQ